MNRPLESSQRRRRKWLRRLERRAIPFGLGRWQLPHFMVIGAQKAGTTWLHQNLLCHPEVFLPGMKELHYFNSDLERTLFGYARYFTKAENQKIGEITPAYSILSEEDVGFIARLFPRLRIILMARNPIERAWSQAVMEVATREGRAFDSIPDQDFQRFLASPACFDRGDYPSMLARWEKHFDSSQILVSFFDELKTNPEGVLEEVFAHIGASAVDDWEPFPVRAVVAPIVEKNMLAEKKIAGGFLVDEASAAQKEATKKPMPESVRKFLAGQYQDVIAKMKDRFQGSTENW